MKNLVYLLFGVIVLVSCRSESDEETVEMMGVKSLLWYQFSAESEALYIQGYNIASQIVKEYKSKENKLPAAVTLDIDETVLDNSPFNVNMLREGFKYSEKKWAEWCLRREARPLPGALGFVRLADSLGIEVFYISNRAANLMDATIDNLKQYGFPNADSLHLLLKTSGSSKDIRREVIRMDFEIILLIGDNLGDFEGLFDDRSEEYGKKSVREYEKEFGNRFIILPNPIYGSWEKAVFPGGMPGEKEVLEVLRGSE